MENLLPCFVGSKGISGMTRPILIVEDDPDISESLKYNFEREGLPAITALTGEAGAGAALYSKGVTSLIILDVIVSGVNGTELCCRPPGVPPSLPPPPINF